MAADTTPPAFWKDGHRTAENPCCSAIEPCPTQQRDPHAVCDICFEARALKGPPSARQAEAPAPSVEIKAVTLTPEPGRAYTLTELDGVVAAMEPGAEALMQEAGAYLRDALVTLGIDTPVANVVTSPLNEAQRDQPGWLWFERDQIRTTFGRWSKILGSAPYVRGDILARAFAAALSAHSQGAGAVPDSLRQAFERVKRSIENGSGFPEGVEAERAFTLAAYEGVGAMLATPRPEPAPARDGAPAALGGDGVFYEPNDAEIDAASEALFEHSDWAMGDTRARTVGPCDFKDDARAALKAAAAVRALQPLPADVAGLAMLVDDLLIRQAAFIKAGDHVSGALWDARANAKTKLLNAIAALSRRADGAAAGVAVSAELRRLSGAATKGEWRVETDTTLVWGDCTVDTEGFVERMGVPVVEAQLARGWAKDGQPDHETAQYNAALSAAAVNDLRARIKAEDRLAGGADGREG